MSEVNPGHYNLAKMWKSILLFFILPQSLQTPWIPLRVSGGAFEIKAPGAMTLTEQEIETDIGIIDYHTYHLNYQDEEEGFFTFIVSFYRLQDVPAEDEDPDFYHEFLDATVQESTMAVGGEIIFEDQVNIDGHPGRFWRMHYNGGDNVIKSKAYIANGYFYSLQVASGKENSLSSLIDQFFDSFRLMDDEKIGDE